MPDIFSHFLPIFFLLSLPMLNRSISRWEMVLLFINGVIGAGIFDLPSKAFKEVGVYSIAALLVCAVTVLIIIICFAEVSNRFDKTGGPYLYAHSSLGPFGGFITGWLLLLTRFITFAALINLMVTYLSFFSDWFANAIGNLKETHLSNFFKRISFRRGRAAAISATARKLAIIIWNMAVKAIPYSPPSTYEFLDQKRKRKLMEMKRLIHKFNITTNDLGLQL